MTAAGARRRAARIFACKHTQAKQVSVSAGEASWSAVDDARVTCLTRALECTFVMGKVVKLEAQGTTRGKGAPGRSGRRRRRSKTALVLGGGGFTGGVYEIGALRALDLLSVNRTVNEFDVYVGTSAGSFVASAVANGVTPEEMMRVIVQHVPTPFPDARVSSLLKPNYLEFVTKG